MSDLNLEGSYINGKILSLMRNILDLAVKECGLDRRYPDEIKKINAKSRSKAKEYSGDEEEVDSNDVVSNHWEEDEFKKFISVVDDPRYKLLFETLFWTGLRIGELRALKFGDIKKIKGQWQLTIYNTYTNDKIKTGNKEKDLKSKLSSVKTTESRRNVILGEYIENKLVNYKEDCGKDPDYSLNNFVFFNGVDKPVSYNAINSAREKYVKLSGVKNITLHGFRHSRASYLIRNSEPGQIAAVASLLGHSVNECLKTYTHFYSKDKQNIIDRGENEIPQEIILTQDGIDKDGSPRIKMDRQMVGFTTEAEKNKFGLKSRIIPEEEYTDEDHEALKELENFDPGKIEYVSEDKIFAFLNETEDDED